MDLNETDNQRFDAIARKLNELMETDSAKGVYFSSGFTKDQKDFMASLVISALQEYHQAFAKDRPGPEPV